ncbi:MAG: T9SS type A sorting domain-containing protein [Saprospiraceae bacterium]
MFKKFSIALIWAYFACFSFASPSLPATIVPNPEFTECDWPAPLNFRVEDAGTDWVLLAWDPILPNVVQHRVKTYLTNGNILVSNIVVPANQNTQIVNNLIPGEQYYSTIYAICPDGTDSKYFMKVDHPDGFITELIVSGYTGSNNLPICGVNATGEYCEFPIAPNITTFFKFRHSNNYNLTRKFATYRESTSGKLRAKIDPADGDGIYQFRIDNQVPDDQGVPGIHFQVFTNGGTLLLGVFQLYYHYSGGQTVGRLICESITDDYEIVKITSSGNAMKPPSDALQGSLEDRSSLVPAQLALAVAPNPFNATLDVMVNRSVQEKGNIQLLNLSGQAVLEQPLIVGQERHTIHTAHMPAGFYFLRIEVDGEIKTLKVVKSD